MELELVGLNLEGLLSRAAQAGIRVRMARRVDERTMRVRIDAAQRETMEALCARCGWAMREVRAGGFLRLSRWLRAHWTRAAAVVVFVALTAVSSQLLWAVRVENAGRDAAEIRRFVREEGLLPGRPKRTISTDALREALMLRLPDLAYASVNWAGSTLVIDCQEALTGEQVLAEGDGAAMEAERYEHCATVAKAMPGVFSINLCTLLGRELHGKAGSLAAVSGLLLPPFVIMVFIAGLFGDVRTQPQMAAFLRGVRPAVIALLVIPVVRTLRSTNITLANVWLPIGAAVAIWLLGLPPFVIVLGIIIPGLLYGFFIKPNE